MDYEHLAPLAAVARLPEGSADAEDLLGRLVRHAVELVPGCDGAALTIALPESGHTAAATDDAVTSCHAAQFHEDGDGPAREVLLHREPRRMDDVAEELRWPVFCRTAQQVGLHSCLALPLRTDRLPAAALNLYSRTASTFTGAVHDVALLFALHGAVALDNTDLYRQSQMLVGQLQQALESRGLIERAKGVLIGRSGVSDEEAFDMLRVRSQQQNLRLRDVAEELLAEADPSAVPRTSWTPMRNRPVW